MPTLLAVLSLLLAVLAAFASETAAAVASGFVLLALVLLVVYGLYMRDHYGGIYEILECTNTWDLSDPNGAVATFTKRNRVRFIQNNVLAIPDYVWGDGSSHEYRCSPGRQVDEFKEGHRVCKVISLGKAYKRDEELVLEISRTVKDAFTSSAEWLEVRPVVGTPHLELNVIFPEGVKAHDVVMTTTKDATGETREKRLEKFDFDNGRQRLTVNFRRPPPDELIRIDWRW